MTRPKKKPLRWLSAARDDLAEIVAYIARAAPQTAEEFAEKLLNHVEMLAHFPYLGPVCPYSKKARQLIHGNYVIYYTVHRSEVVVRAVVRGFRLFRRSWLQRE